MDRGAELGAKHRTTFAVAGTDATAGGHRLGKETVRTADELALTRLVLSRWQPARRADLRWLNLE